LASQICDHFGSEVKSDAATWLALKSMDEKEAKKNAPKFHLDPEALASLKGRGDDCSNQEDSSKSSGKRLTKEIM
jgi:hypothetical protein